MRVLHQSQADFALRKPCVKLVKRGCTLDIFTLVPIQFSDESTGPIRLEWLLLRGVEEFCLKLSTRLNKNTSTSFSILI